jgi:hypothetical protein
MSKKFIAILVSVFAVCGMAVMTGTAEANGTSTLEVVPFTLQTAEGGTAEWATAEKQTGSSSVKLTTTATDGSFAGISMAYTGKTLSQITSLSFGYKGGGANFSGPYLAILLDTDGDDAADYGAVTGCAKEAANWKQIQAIPGSATDWYTTGTGGEIWWHGASTGEIPEAGTTGEGPVTWDGLQGVTVGENTLGNANVLQIAIYIGVVSTTIGTGAGTAYVDNPEVNDTTYYGQIQDTIDAAAETGDTINVAAGTYEEAITINKSLTLKAASKPVIDCSDRTTLGLEKTDGCIEVTADNVTIQGFNLIGYDPTGETWADQKSSSNYATIKVTSGADSLKVKDNEFTGTTETSKAAVGLLIDDDCADVEFTGNTVTDYLQGVVGHKDVDNLLVEDNKFTIPIAECISAPDEADEAYGYGVQLWHGNNLQVINNTFTGSWDTATGDYEDPEALCNHYAVSTFTTYFANAYGWPDIVGDIHIKGNEMANLYLGVGSFAGGGEIEDNTGIRDNLIGIQLGQVSGTWATAPTAGLSITGNDIENNKRGIWVQSFIPDGIAANFNNIVGNSEYGVINEDPENNVFDATLNWWGDSGGPSTIWEVDGEEVWMGEGDKVSDNVEFNPWLLKPKDEEQTSYDQCQQLVNLGEDWNDGWNLVSTPKILDTEAEYLNQMIVGYGDAIDIAYRYDSDDKTWAQFTSSNLFQLEPLDAVWIKVKDLDPDESEFEGMGFLFSRNPIQTPPSRDLPVNRWSLIGPSLLGDINDIPVKTALDSVKDYQGYRGYSQVYSPYDNWTYTQEAIETLGEGGPVFYPYRGYWVFMVNAGTLASSGVQSE